MQPDIVVRINASLHYESVTVHRHNVPMIAPPGQLVGRRLPDVLGRELMYQVATAAERAICTEQPIEIRYPMKLGNRLVHSRTVIRADSRAKILLFDIARLLTGALICVVPL